MKLRATDWQDLDSSNIEAAAWGAEDDRLFLRFHTGTVYSYPGVPIQVYEALLRSDSPGTFFAKARGWKLG